MDAIGFVWDPFEEQWEQGFAALKAFQRREGHCRVPARHNEGTFKLGQWVGTQRREDSLSAEHMKRLNEIGFVWDPLEEQWEQGFAALKAFKAREGHCRVRQEHAEGAFKLGSWVSNQRTTRARLSPERQRRLDAIGFVWDPLDEAWERGFTALQAFNQREGHCRVPTFHIEGKSRLGQWVAVQRQSRDVISVERRKRLDRIGFVWVAGRHGRHRAHERDWKRKIPPAT